MNVIWVILLGYTLAFIIEAFHDYNIIENELSHQMNTDNLRRSRNWHIFGWWYLFITASTLAYGVYGLSYKMVFLLVSISTLKVCVFNTLLNVLRDLNIFHLSKKGLESKFNETAYYLSSFAILLLSIYLITG